MWICYPLCRAWSLHWQQNTTHKSLWVDNIAHCRASLFGNRSQRSLFSTFQIGEGLINAGSPKEGRFCKTKRLVVVDGDGSLWHNMRLPSFQTRPTMRRIWSEMFLKPENNTVWKLWQLSIIYLSRIIMIPWKHVADMALGVDFSFYCTPYFFLLCCGINWKFPKHKNF